MNKIACKPKITKINANSILYEIKLTMKGPIYRARTSSLAQIYNVTNPRPEATSKFSFNDAINKLIPKIESSLSGTNKKLGEISHTSNGKIVFCVENIINNEIETLNKNQNFTIDMLYKLLSEYSNNISNINNTTDNLVSNNTQNTKSNFKDSVTFEDVTIKWLKFSYNRTLKDPNDIDYLSPTTLEKNYNSNVTSYILPYLKENPTRNYIKVFSEMDVDKILLSANGQESKRMLLICMRLIFEFAVEHNYIDINPIKNKKLKKKKTAKKEYSFIEDDERALWINCMLKDFESNNKKSTDAPLAFLFTLLHGTRPEETCGTRWVDLNFKQNDFHVQNAYKINPIYDKVTMKRIGWVNEDGPLKTPESNRHITIDLLIRDLLIEHKKQQQKEFRKNEIKWSENQYVFLNSSRTPFTPKVLSRNFSKFIKKNNLPHMVLYGLRHSFATHCRNFGMTPEVLAVLMGHTEYETTQKYYIHVSPKQKREELQKIQNQDIQIYLDTQNKDLKHLQNNINDFCIANNKILDLKEIQNKDMTHYLKTENNELYLLLNLINKIYKQKNIA